VQYFIDTNLIIDAFQRKNSESQNKLMSILEDEENEIFYNGLVYTEALRCMLDEDMFSTLKASFEYFTWIDINQSIYIETKKFSRYCRSKGIKVAKGKCELIDMIHFITAKENNLTLLSGDGDMEKLEKCYEEFQKKFLNSVKAF
jgi:predicted nucleic acid-binding protein